MVFSKLREKVASTKEQDKYIVGLDIGTEFVKALIARADGDKLEIAGVGRTRQDVSDMHSGAVADITGVVRNCEDALAQAEEEAGVQAKRAVIGIAGELVKGVTNTIRYRRPQPTALDVQEMEFIIEKVQERAQDKAQKQIALETGNDDVEIKLVNRRWSASTSTVTKSQTRSAFRARMWRCKFATAFAPMDPSVRSKRSPTSWRWI